MKISEEMTKELCGTFIRAAMLLGYAAHVSFDDESTTFCIADECGEASVLFRVTDSTISWTGEREHFGAKSNDEKDIYGSIRDLSRYANGCICEFVESGAEWFASTRSSTLISGALDGNSFPSSEAYAVAEEIFHKAFLSHAKTGGGFSVGIDYFSHRITIEDWSDHED